MDTLPFSRNPPNISEKPAYKQLEIVKTSLGFDSKLQELCNKKAPLRLAVKADAPKRAQGIRALPWTKALSVQLFLTRVQLIDCALKLFKLLSGLAKFAFRCEALIVGKVLSGFRDECIEIC
jgi:hypothetical protein